MRARRRPRRRWAPRAGEVALTPVVATALTTESAEARVVGGGILALTGSLRLDAVLDAAATASATADVTNASTAGVGVSLALAMPDHRALATIARDVNAGGDVLAHTFLTSKATTTAVASAAGAPENAGGGGDGGDGVDQQLAGERAHADGVATTAGGAASQGTAPSAETSGGKVNAAAAIALTLATAVSRATITGATVVAAGQVRLAALENADQSASADGSAANGATATIGAGVALTRATVSTEAILPAGTTVTAGSLQLSTATLVDGDDAASVTTAQSAAGAGDGKISVAGSVALALLTHSSLASLRGTANVDGAVLISAANRSDIVAKALPHGDGVSGAATLGIGASFALAIATGITTAELADGAALVGADALTVFASGRSTMTAEARMGATGGGVALTPVVATALSTESALARIGTGADVAVGGAIRLDAVTDAASHATATAEVEGAGDAGIGVALALAMPQHRAIAEVARNISAGGGRGPCLFPHLHLGLDRGRIGGGCARERCGLR